MDFRASAPMRTRSALFRDFTQCMILFPEWCSAVQEECAFMRPRPSPWTVWPLKAGLLHCSETSVHCVKFQKRVDLMDFLNSLSQQYYVTCTKYIIPCHVLPYTATSSPSLNPDTFLDISLENHYWFISINKCINSIVNNVFNIDSVLRKATLKIYAEYYSETLTFICKIVWCQTTQDCTIDFTISKLNTLLHNIRYRNSIPQTE